MKGIEGKKRKMKMINNEKERTMNEKRLLTMNINGK